MRTSWDFPGGPEAKNPPTNAGDMGLIPGLGIFHMLPNNEACAQQLLSLHAYNSCPATREATSMRSPSTTTKTQCNQKLFFLGENKLDYL